MIETWVAFFIVLMCDLCIWNKFARTLKFTNMHWLFVGIFLFSYFSLKFFKEIDLRDLKDFLLFLIQSQDLTLTYDHILTEIAAYGISIYIYSGCASLLIVISFNTETPMIFAHFFGIINMIFSISLSVSNSTTFALILFFISAGIIIFNWIKTLNYYGQLIMILYLCYCGTFATSLLNIFYKVLDIENDIVIYVLTSVNFISESIVTFAILFYFGVFACHIHDFLNQYPYIEGRHKQANNLSLATIFLIFGFYFCVIFMIFAIYFGAVLYFDLVGSDNKILREGLWMIVSSYMARIMSLSSLNPDVFLANVGNFMIVYIQINWLRSIADFYLNTNNL